MNNYYDFLDKSSSNVLDLFGPYEGYLNGNMFKDLYNQYKNYRPNMVRINNEKEESIFNLNQVQFAMHELNLYLDVYPNDRNAMNIFLNYKNTYKQLLEDYENKYGPLEVCGVNGGTPFSWVNDKFPWEVM